MGESTAVPVAVDTGAEARKRRKAIITQHRGHDDAAVPPPSQSPAAAGSGRGTGPSDEGESPGGGASAEEGLAADNAGESATVPSSHREGAGPDVDSQGSAAAQHDEDPLGDESEDQEGKASEAIDKGKGTSSEAEDGDEELADRVYTKKRTQVRYDPDVPMSKEQLAMWRRECRRVRNRESAAASRARVRGRIQELEEEVEGWKAKYAQAVERLERLQKTPGGQPSAAENTLQNRAAV